MCEITIHTGTQCDWNTINVAWFNENNVPQKTTLEIVVQEQDKPRTLEIRLNGAIIAIIPNINSLPLT